MCSSDLDAFITSTYEVMTAMLKHKQKTLGQLTTVKSD